MERLLFGEVGEGEEVTFHALYLAASPAFAAAGDVAFVAADFHLLPFGQDFAVGIDAGIDDGFSSAGACGFHFIDSVGHFKEAAGTLEEVSLKVGAQAVADDVDAEVVDDSGELVDLRSGEELGLIDENPARGVVGREPDEVANHYIEVGVGLNPGAFALDTDSAADDVAVIAGVDDRFHAEILQTSFLEVIGGSEQQGGFSGAHGAVSEIKLGVSVHEIGRGFPVAVVTWEVDDSESRTKITI